MQQSSQPDSGSPQRWRIVWRWLACTQLPAPYWCTDEAGRYVHTVHTNSTKAKGGKEVAPACNPEAAHAGGLYALLMCLAALGYIIADVAADGLTARRHHAAARLMRCT